MYHYEYFVYLANGKCMGRAKNLIRAHFIRALVKDALGKPSYWKKRRVPNDADATKLPMLY